MCAKSETAFEKDFYKLMNNAVFGKLLEDVWKHIDDEIAYSEKRFLKLVVSTSYSGCVIFSNDLVGV